MTQAAWLLLALAAAVAVLDWIGTVHANTSLRWVTKPSVILLLIAAALLLHPRSGVQREVFIGALALGLVGDLLLLRGWFLGGLAAFFGGHLAYVAGFLVGGVSGGLLWWSAAIVAVVALVVGGRILRAVWRGAERGMTAPVAGYLLAISTMVALAGATGRPLAVAGAGLFYASDGLIAWRRFVQPLGWAELPIIVTYHVGQAALVLSLTT